MAGDVWQEALACFKCLPRYTNRTREIPCTDSDDAIGVRACLHGGASIHLLTLACLYLRSAYLSGCRDSRSNLD